MSRTQRLTLIAAILGSTVVFLDSTVVNVALPAIADGLDAGLASQQWVVEAYLLTLVAFMMVGGALGDQFGRRRMFVTGLAGFAATSALCAIAPSDEFLVAARALQGIAGALLVPGSLALVAHAFEGPARGAAVGTWTAWTGIATVIGPAGGGLLVDELSWRWIFWINLPLVAVTIALALRGVEESRDPESVPGFDWPGVGLSALGFAGPVFALIEQPARGWSDPLVWAPLAAGLLLLGAFVAHERRSPHPMLDLALFRVRNFTVTNIVTFAVYAGLMGGLFFLPLFLQQTAGYSAVEAGLATTPMSVLLFVLSSRFGRAASALGPRAFMAAGPILAGIGMLLLIRVDAGADYLSEVLPAVLVFGVGLATTVAPLTATVLDSVPERRSGTASGINNGVSRVAGVLAIAVLGAAVSASFQGTLDDELAQRGLGPEAARAVAEVKQRPLGAPLVGGLPPDEAAALERAAARASESAFHLSALLGGLLMICGGSIAAILVRNPRRRPERLAPLAPTAGDCGHEGSSAVSGATDGPATAGAAAAAGGAG